MSIENFKFYKANRFKKGIVIEHCKNEYRVESTCISTAIVMQELVKHPSGEERELYIDLNTGKIYEKWQKNNDNGIYFSGDDIYPERLFVSKTRVLKDIQSYADEFNADRSYFARNRNLK